MHTLRINLPIRAAVQIDDDALAPLGVEHVFLDSVENWENVDVILDIADGRDDRAIIAYLRALPS